MEGISSYIVVVAYNFVAMLSFAFKL